MLRSMENPSEGEIRLDQCGIIRIVGIFLCLFSLIGVVLNGSLFISFIRYDFLRTTQNIFLIFLSLIGLFASMIILPLTGSSSIFCHWLFYSIGCQLEAMMAFLYGCSTSYLLCAVCLTRAFILVKPHQAKRITTSKCVLTSLLSVCLALILTLCPIFGWNEYVIEGTGTSCCVNWTDRRWSYLSYNIVLFIFVYLIPLMILILSNSIIFYQLKRMRENLLRGIKTELSQRRIEMEQRIFKSIIITIGGFLLSWTPYAIAFCLSVIGGEQTLISPLITFFCACFAKCSVVWIPMLYLTTSTQFRLTFVDRSFIEKNLSQNPHEDTINRKTNLNDQSNISIIPLQIQQIEIQPK